MASRRTSTEQSCSMAFSHIIIFCRLVLRSTQCFEQYSSNLRRATCSTLTPLSLHRARNNATISSLLKTTSRSFRLSKKATFLVRIYDFRRLEAGDESCWEVSSTGLPREGRGRERPPTSTSLTRRGWNYSCVSSPSFLVNGASIETSDTVSVGPFVCGSEASRKVSDLLRMPVELLALTGFC